jgi:PAS domain S-box-containing protein
LSAFEKIARVEIEGKIARKINFFFFFFFFFFFLFLFSLFLKPIKMPPTKRINFETSGGGGGGGGGGCPVMHGDMVVGGGGGGGGGESHPRGRGRSATPRAAASGGGGPGFTPGSLGSLGGKRASDAESDAGSETSRGSSNWSHGTGGSMRSHEGRLAVALSDLHTEGLHTRMEVNEIIADMDTSTRAEFAPVLAEILTVLTNMESPVIIMNTSCIALVVSPSVARVFGYTTEEISNNNVNMLMPKEVAVVHDSIVARYSAVPTSAVQRSTIVNNVRPTIGRHKSGAPVPIEVSVRAIRGHDKLPCLYVAVIRDTRTEYMMRATLRESEFLEISFPFPYICASAEGIIEKFNPAAEQTFGTLGVYLFCIFFESLVSAGGTQAFAREPLFLRCFFFYYRQAYRARCSRFSVILVLAWSGNDIILLSSIE